MTTLIFVTAAGGSAVDALDQDEDKAWQYDVGEVKVLALAAHPPRVACAAPCVHVKVALL